MMIFTDITHNGKGQGKGKVCPITGLEGLEGE
jgi:hypothetical protein